MFMKSIPGTNCLNKTHDCWVPGEKSGWKKPIRCDSSAWEHSIVKHREIIFPWKTMWSNFRCGYLGRMLFFHMNSKGACSRRELAVFSSSTSVRGQRQPRSKCCCLENATQLLFQKSWEGGAWTVRPASLLRLKRLKWQEGRKWCSQHYIILHAAR